MLGLTSPEAWTEDLNCPMKIGSLGISGGVHTWGLMPEFAAGTRKLEPLRYPRGHKAITSCTNVLSPSCLIS